MNLDHAIWWHVYPLGFAGAPIRDHANAGQAGQAGHSEHSDQLNPPGDGLQRLTGWLDYAVELGVNGLLLGPVFESTSHGYDTLDHWHVDRRLGTDADLDHLIEQSNARGVGIMLDGVFNHVSHRHPLYLQALREGPDSFAAQHFRIDWSGPSPRPAVFEGHDHLVELDLSRQAAQDLVVDVMTHWLDRGVAGWRLDAAYAIDRRHWRSVIDRVRAAHPAAVLLGEVIHGDYAATVQDGGLSTVTQYELWKALWSSLVDRNLFELDWALKRHEGFLESFLPQTFAGNHDVTRIASRVGLDGSLVAHAVLLTVAGMPSIYYGDERGWRGVKEERVGGDDAVRPAFPATPDDLDELDPAGWGMHAQLRELIALRRRHPWLVRAHRETLELSTTRMRYRCTPTEALETAHAGSPEWLEVTVDLGEQPGHDRVRIDGPDGRLFG